MATSTSTPTTGAETGEPGTAPRLVGDAVLLRPLVRGDLGAALTLAGDKRVAEMTARIAHPLTMAGMEEWFELVQASPSEQVFAILSRTDGTFMGVIGLLPLPRDAGRAEIGFWLGVPYWGQGFMAEAIGLMLEHAFGTMGLAAVQAGAFPENVRSQRVQERMGFRPVGRAVRPAPARGRDRELVMYAI